METICTNRAYHGRGPRHAIRALAAAAIVVTAAFSTGAAADITSYARVLDDGTLRVGRHLVRLHGIHIPPSGRS